MVIYSISFKKTYILNLKHHWERCFNSLFLKVCLYFTPILIVDIIGVNVPNGFAVTSKAYFHFLETAKIDSKLRQLLDGVDINDTRDLENRGQKVRMTILKAKFPPELTEAITEAYHRLEADYNEGLQMC
jgi:hypothetical protein